MRTRTRWRHSAAPLLLLAALGLPGLGAQVGCSTYSPLTEVEPGIELRSSFLDSGVEVADRWWLELDDPGLEQVMSRVLADNLDLRMAWARLDQARALARAAGSGRYPSATVAAGVDRQELGGDAATFEGVIETRTASLGVSYVLDLWQKIASTHRAALLDVAASRRDAEATALAVTATAGELWYAIAAQNETLELLDSQLEVSEEYQRLVELRFAKGLVSAVDVYQQRLQLETTRGQIPAAEAQLETSRHQLAILLGLEPRSPAVPMPGSRLPDLQDLPATGLPSEVLRRRPDVQAAELRVLAADRRVGVAIADRFPSISLGASVGGQAASFSELVDSWIVDLAMDVVGPLVDGGRRRAEVERARAAVEERLAAWRSALLGAAAEVEDALVEERALRQSEQILTTQLELAEATLERSRALYLNGLTDYLTVLTSLQSLQSLERQAVSTRYQLLANRIELHLALGGSWSAALVEPATRTEDPT